jgi:serine/threonine-protein kinase
MPFFRSTFRFFAGLTQFVLYSALFFALMLGAGYGIALQFFGGDEAIVPDLTGVSLVQAVERLQPAAAMLQLERSQPHVQVPKGHIISQYPRPGASIKTGAPIRVVLSEGLPLAIVPDLRGSNRIEAGIRLRKLGLNAGTTAAIARPGVPGGTVLTTDPPAGAGVIEGTSVNLLLAAGELARTRQMPNLIGLTADEAREVMESYGLRIDQQREQDVADAPVGQVHSQSPAPGETVGATTRIEIVVQPERPEPEPTPVIPLVTPVIDPAFLDDDAALDPPDPAGDGTAETAPPPAIPAIPFNRPATDP